MRYVFVSYNYTPEFSDPQAWFVRTLGYTGLMDQLSKRHEVINVKQINYEGIVNHNNIAYHFVNFSKKKLHFNFGLNLYVKSLNPDIVIFHGLHQPVQLIQLGLMLGKHTPIIVQNHAEKPFRGGIKKTLQKLADKYADAYLFASHDMGLEWVTAGNLKSADKIHEVMEVSSVFFPTDRSEAESPMSAKGAPVFLWVGRLNDNKDPLNVVRAFLTFAQSYPKAKLFMIYHTEELLPKIKELISASPNKGAIELIGKVPHADLLYWYNRADFIISGSHYEGSGTAICEAMSCGCVPLVTDILSFRMITNNGECGMLYEPGNEAALLEVLMQTSQINVAEKRKLSIEYYKQNLSFEAIAERIEGIAASLV
ncbi:Glycosyltransferase involved in cell wall bisynthesis [Mucilaginibacter gossypiicola]|uniref:Glycosyltransferase involved in cell wall bisynthesis n=1 Tax=Mucilaginibacter gossypiicola TaxID=551995 RepID=A0A1H8G959_9SPHI|nr:glycosyltransferase family 4 protein [Mucilaginibacter gossypiicola]SEN40576.1 Glycosyltransferase involved in cell wall bisynthesis [Mucilaginibacter gossypiicola]